MHAIIKDTPYWVIVTLMSGTRSRGYARQRTSLRLSRDRGKLEALMTESYLLYTGQLSRRRVCPFGRCLCYRSHREGDYLGNNIPSLKPSALITDMTSARGATSRSCSCTLPWQDLSAAEAAGSLFCVGNVHEIWTQPSGEDHCISWIWSSHRSAEDLPRDRDLTTSASASCL